MVVARMRMARSIGRLDLDMGLDLSDASEIQVNFKFRTFLQMMGQAVQFEKDAFGTEFELRVCRDCKGFQFRGITANLD